MPAVREVSLFRNGRSQALRVPREFELPGTRALIYQDGPRLVVEPVAAGTMGALLAGWSDLGEPFPEIEDELIPADEDVFAG